MNFHQNQYEKRRIWYEMLIFFRKNQQNFIRNFAIKIEFRPVRRNVHFVDLEKCCKMTPWSQKSASIQTRTSPPKFLENRGSRMGVPGVMRPRSWLPSARKSTIWRVSSERQNRAWTRSAKADDHGCIDSLTQRLTQTWVNHAFQRDQTTMGKYRCESVKI